MQKLISTASAVNARAAGGRTIGVCVLYIAVAVGAGLFGLMETGDSIQAVFEGLIGIFMRLGLRR